MKILNSYNSKRILITGHTGFKGGWLSIWLNLLGAEVYGYALDPMHKNGIFTASGIGNRINDIRGDIRDLDNLIKVVQSIAPEFVFHLAAQPIVLESYQNPAETFATNTQGTVNILEAIRHTPSVKAAVMITTDKCYENREWVWGYRENEPMGGHDPYSASKGAAELVISAYRRSFFNGNDKPAVASARAGNVIGGGDWAGYRLVPDIFRSVAAEQTIELRNPNATRPWQHVLEPLGGYLVLGAKLFENRERFADAWNFGPYLQDVHTVKAVVEHIIKYAGKGEWKDISQPGRLHEANLLMLDISKAMQELKWKPLLTFEETIQMTTDWYLNYTKQDVLKLSQKQIAEYAGKWNLSNES